MEKSCISRAFYQSINENAKKWEWKTGFRIDDRPPYPFSPRIFFLNVIFTLLKYKKQSQSHHPHIRFRSNVILDIYLPILDFMAVPHCINKYLCIARVHKYFFNGFIVTSIDTYKESLLLCICIVKFPKKKMRAIFKLYTCTRTEITISVYFVVFGFYYSFFMFFYFFRALLIFYQIKRF